MQMIELRSPYLLFVGGETKSHFAKTGRGIADWRPELCAGQFRFGPQAVDLGLPDLTIAEANNAGVQSLIIGTALIGGEIPGDWLAVLTDALSAGMDVVAGLHTRLDSFTELTDAARRAGTQLIDVRTPPPALPVGTGRKRTGKRILTVGTDCALGKKYTALQLEKDMRQAGLNADFRASGQTGIMIAGQGIPIDCVIADFLSGAAEILSPDNDVDHWDIIEGQGGIFHPAYAAVTHGLLIGSQPDAFVVCHAAERTHIEGWPHMALPSIKDVIMRTTQIGELTNPAIRCVGISVNTSALPPDLRDEYLLQLTKEHGLPCVDPLVHGTTSILENL